MKRLPIAKTELREIVEGDFCYVDKTKYIKMLLDDGHKYYFLARPRRFGKSLFLDTLRAAFEGEKELFKGLFLEDNWDWDIKYPVIHISFGGGSLQNIEELIDSILFSLNINARESNLVLKEQNISNAFKELIIYIYEKTSQPVVILIDEYDKPILDNLTKPIVDNIRETISGFYSVLKDYSRYIKFVFLTGISKFSKTSIFSKLNNLTDISLTEKYADICGITQHELEHIFKDHLKDVDLTKLKQWYNGYNFRGEKIYNPYELLMFLWEKEYKSYWFETGTPTFLLDLIKKRKFYIPKLEEIKVLESQLSEFDINNIQLDVLLFQTGYLTIKNIEIIGQKKIYTMHMPNLEVKIGFNEYLMRMFYAAGVNSYERTALTEEVIYALRDKQPERLGNAFKSFFSGIPHDWYRKNNISQFEGFYCSVFYAFFAGLGEDLIAEDVTNKGKIDLTVKTNAEIFIFEFKMKSNTKNSLEQIQEKKYHEKYLTENKEIFLIGIEFDENEKNISHFDWEKINSVAH